MTTPHDLDRFTGHYQLTPDFTFEVRRHGDRLRVHFPGIPEDFAVRLYPGPAPNQFTMRGGPAPGATAIVDDGAITVAGMRFTRVSPGPDDHAANHPRLLPPPMTVDDEKKGVFDRFWNRLQAAQGARVAYDLLYPLHEFLRYLAGLDEVIFHGSPNPDIDEFLPLRTSYELRDPTGRGNLQAVYGTHDGLWPLFFAVVDRARLRGSIRNGVAYFENEAGEQLAAYNFSINAADLPQQPWRSGTLYILPRATFRRLELAPGVPANEWASEEAVRPLARLTVAPEDFPFLDRIAGHDDGEILRLGELLGKLLKATSSAALDEDTLDLTLTWRDALGGELLELIAIGRVQLPAARFTLTFPPEQAAPTLRITAPMAFLQSLVGPLQAQGHLHP